MDQQELEQRYQQLISAGMTEEQARGAVERWAARQGFSSAATAETQKPAMGVKGPVGKGRGIGFMDAARERMPDSEEALPRGDWIRMGAQGLTAGFGDEIEAKITGRPIEDIRAGIEAVRKQNPVGALAAEMVGGAPLMFIPGVGQARGVQALSTAGRIAKGAKLGAGFGLLSGVGHGEDAASRAVGGAAGGLLGGVLGGALPLAGNFASHSLARSRDHGMLRAPLNLLNRATGGRLSPALTPQTDDAVADALVSRALMRDGVDLDDAAALFDPPDGSASAVLPEERMIDLFGTSTRRTARGAMAQPNSKVDEATQFLEARGEGEIARVSNILDDFFEVPDVNVDRVAEGLKDGMRQRADAAYRAAYDAPYEPSEQIQRLMNSGSVRDLVRGLQRQARGWGVEASGDFAFSMTPSGAYGVSPRPTVRNLDMLKRAMDKKISSAFAAGGDEVAAVPMYQRVRELILTELDEAVPEYGAARRLWAGDLEVEAALERGRSLGRGATRRQVENAIEGASEAEQEMVRLGWMSGLRERIAGRNPGDRISELQIGVKPSGIVRQDTEDTFRLLFPDNDVDGFFSALQRQANMRQSERVVGLGAGSRTAYVEAELADMRNLDGMDVAVQAAKRRGLRAGLDAAVDASERARYGPIAAGVLNRTVMQDPRTVVNNLRNSVDPEAIRRGLLWGDNASRASGALSGLLSGDLTGTVFSNLFN